MPATALALVDIETAPTAQLTDSLGLVVSHPRAFHTDPHDSPRRVEPWAGSCKSGVMSAKMMAVALRVNTVCPGRIAD